MRFCSDVTGSIVSTSKRSAEKLPCQHIPQCLPEDGAPPALRRGGQHEAAHHPHQARTAAPTQKPRTEASFFQMPKTLFLPQETCTGRWERGCESGRFSTEATVGGLSGDAWPVSPWPVPRAEGQEVAMGSWEHTSPPLCVCFKLLSATSFKWTASTGPSDRGPRGICRERFTSASLSFNCLYWLQRTGFVAPCLKQRRYQLLSCGHLFRK